MTLTIDELQKWLNEEIKRLRLEVKDTDGWGDSDERVVRLQTLEEINHLVTI